jgi:hypothetical protein
MSRMLIRTSCAALRLSPFEVRTKTLEETGVNFFAKGPTIGSGARLKSGARPGGNEK